MASGRALTFACAASILISCLVPLSAGEDEEEYGLFVSVDETKVNVISGNLTLSVPSDSWPRMVFWHTVDPFSPTFDIGFPKMYLFNDSDQDGVFCRSEAVYTAYLDASHAEWIRSSVVSGFGANLGKFVTFSMTASVDAYNETLDAPPVVECWANVTFWFRLTENAVEYENPVGTHVVSGKTEMFVNMTVDVTNRTSFECVAVERSLQGGATTSLFHVMEDGPGSEVTATLSARVDEAVEGDNFTRPLNTTESPTQCIEVVHEDGMAQASYCWGSAALDMSDGRSAVPLNSSCYTTGAGLILDSALLLSNGTLSFSLDSGIGIVESGFVGSVTDWVREAGVALVIAVAAAVAAVVIAAHVVLRRRRQKRESVGPDVPEEKD